MARTKQEVRDFLNSQVGQRVNAKSGIYSGQCVSLIKALLEFLGVPNPYAGRGNAISVDDTLLREGIAANGVGWLTIVVNRDMGRIFENGVWNNYGHIWIDLQNEANFEQNGAKALYTTKNTRPIQQGQQFVNLDKYISESEDGSLITKNDAAPMRVINSEVKGWDFNSTHSGAQDTRELNAWVGQPWVKHIMQAWGEGGWYRELKNKQAAFYNQYVNIIGELSARPTQAELQVAVQKLADASVMVDKAQARANAAEAKSQELADKNAELIAQDEADKTTADTWLRRLGQFLAKYWTVK